MILVNLGGLIMLKDLGVIFDEQSRIASEFLSKNDTEVILSTEFKENYKEHIDTLGDEIYFEQYNSKYHTNSKFIIIPNQWFYLAFIAAPYYKEFLKYKSILLDALSGDDFKEFCQTARNGELDENLFDTISVDLTETDTLFLKKFVTDYHWWHGGKEIHRGDSFISPILALLKLINASSEHVAIIVKYLVDADFDLSDVNKYFELVEMDSRSVVTTNYDNTNLVGDNILLYGVPGSGKSFKIATEYCNDENRMERLVFHPDYMNTDFVGQIMPTVKENGDITYLFSPGPFTRIVKKAINNPSEHYYLVIEELNRGNAPGIFGEIFQLLDRSASGESVYGINNSILATEIYGDKSHQIKIPSNLSLLATMNTADQNVFTLDTAFQRRWTMEMIENDVDLSEYGNYFIADTQYSWKVFNKVINKKILETSSQTLTSEDKRMGAYFISGNVLNIERIHQVPAGDSGNEFNKKNKRFAEKVLKYLWDDAFKFNREDIFDVALYPSLETIIKRFTDNDNPENGRFDVFAKDIKEELENLREATLIDNNNDTGEEDADSTE